MEKDKKGNNTMPKYEFSIDITKDGSQDVSTLVVFESPDGNFKPLIVKAIFKGEEAEALATILFEQNKKIETLEKELKSFKENIVPSV